MWQDFASACLLSVDHVSEPVIKQKALTQAVILISYHCFQLSSQCCLLLPWGMRHPVQCLRIYTLERSECTHHFSNNCMCFFGCRRCTLHSLCLNMVVSYITQISNWTRHQAARSYHFGIQAMFLFWPLWHYRCTLPISFQVTICSFAASYRPLQRHFAHGQAGVFGLVYAASIVSETWLTIML